MQIIVCTLILGSDLNPILFSDRLVNFLYALHIVFSNFILPGIPVSQLYDI